MTKYSLLIEDVTREELLEFLGSRVKPKEASKSQDDTNVPKTYQSCATEAKKSICAHCGIQIYPSEWFEAGGNLFCTLYCLSRWEEMHPGMTVPEKPQEPDIRTLIEGYMRIPRIEPKRIMALLAGEHDIQISHQALGGFIGQIKKANHKVAKATMKDCSAIYLAKPLGAYQKPVGETSQPNETILPQQDKKATEAEIMTMYNKKHFTPSAIAQILEIPIGEVEKVVWRRGPKT